MFPGEAENIPLKTKNACAKYVLSIWGPLRHSCDKMDQAFPVHFCILQVIESWTVGRPGNEAHLLCIVVVGEKECRV